MQDVPSCICVCCRIQHVGAFDLNAVFVSGWHCHIPSYSWLPVFEHLSFEGGFEFDSV